MSKKGHNDIAL